MTIDRREFLKTAAAAGVGLSLSGCATLQKMGLGKKPVRWRGFNLTEKFTQRGNKPFEERDFAWIAGWGFNFARLPMDYRCWQGEGREKTLQEIDAAIELGKQYGVHINLNLHRAPGYCINPPEEPLNLWKDAAALDQCAAEWAMLSARYKGVPAERLSFDLLNEPDRCELAEYERVVRRLVKDIREADPARPIMADGWKVGSKPMPNLAELGIWQSTRGYAPGMISHYKAPWAGNSQIPPAWPMRVERKKKDKNGKETVSIEVWDRERLVKDVIGPWKELQALGVKIHVGEFGSYKFTPHAVALAWMGDYLELWKEAGWGWSLWNLRGTFGIVDSGRDDVSYEALDGQKLDRKMLELLQAG